MLFEFVYDSDSSGALHPDGVSDDEGVRPTFHVDKHLQEPGSSKKRARAFNDDDGDGGGDPYNDEFVTTTYQTASGRVVRQKKTQQDLLSVVKQICKDEGHGMGFPLADGTTYTPRDLADAINGERPTGMRVHAMTERAFYDDLLAFWSVEDEVE